MNCRIVLWNSVDAEKPIEKVRQMDSKNYLSLGHAARKKMADILLSFQEIELNPLNIRLIFTTFRSYLVTILKTLYPIFVGLILYSKYVLYSRPLEGLKFRGHDLPPLVGIGWTDLPTAGGVGRLPPLPNWFLRPWYYKRLCVMRKLLWKRLSTCWCFINWSNNVKVWITHSKQWKMYSNFKNHNIIASRC